MLEWPPWLSLDGRWSPAKDRTRSHEEAKGEMRGAEVMEEEKRRRREEDGGEEEG